MLEGGRAELSAAGSSALRSRGWPEDTRPLPLTPGTPCSCGREGVYVP